MIKVVRITTICTLFGLLAVLGCQQPDPSPKADTVYSNGRIYLGNVDNPWASDMAVSGNSFVYIGDDASSFIGPATRVIDLGGQNVIPGIIDGHTHPGLVALSQKVIELEPASNKEELLATIRNMVAEYPQRPVLLGGFWRNEIFDASGPRKEDLDAIEPNRPLILYDDWTHSIWVNSKALEMAGVTRDTPDIVPGFAFYQKDENGEPTGWITESAASVFINHFQTFTPQVEESLIEYLEYFRSMGVTTILDAGNFGLDREVYTLISNLDKQGKLPVRYHGSYTLFKPDDLPGAVQTLKELGEEFNSERLRIDTLKVFYDGVMETRTAALSNDYLDTPGNNGEELLSREQVHQLILELEAAGLNLHVHSVGDRGTTTLLDAVQDAHISLSRAPNIRITICHLELVKTTDFARFKKLGVIANFTPHWAVGGDRSWLEAGIGHQVTEMQRGQPFLSEGVVVTFSSDNTVESEWKNDREASSPFVGIQVGHTRQDIDVGPDGPILPPISDRLQLDDMVNGYTTNSAYQLGREDEIGTIAVGKRADFLVLNQNLFEVDKYQIYKTKPIAVIVDGALVSGQLEAE